MSRAVRALTERAPRRSRALIPLGQPFFAAFAAFAFHGGLR
jgi:hypothetical protein